MYKVITPATDEPITLEEAKAHLRVDSSDENAVITRAISGARHFAEHYTGRAFARQTLEQAMPCFPDGEFNLELGPVDSITSIKYTDANGVEQTLDPADYVLSTYGTARTVHPAYGVTWPDTRGPLAVRVRYVTGYEEAPVAAVSGMLLIVGHLFENRQEASSLKLADIPIGARDLLNTVKVWGF